MEADNCKEKRAEPNLIAFVCSWIVFTYAGIITFVISPVILVVFFYSIYPVLLINDNWRKGVLRVLARASNLQFITCVRLAGIKVMMSGENLDRLADCRALILPNHLSFFDHFIFMTAADTFGMNVVGRWTFVIYNTWVYTPLGLLWSHYGNYFIDSAPPHKREQALSGLRNHFDHIYYEADLRWVCLYPEGSRLFLIKERNIEFELKQGLPPLKNCAYPRLGAAVSAIKVLGPDPNDPKKANNGKGPPLKYLVDVTLGYPGGEILPTHEAFLSSWRNGGGKPYAIHYELFDMDPKWSNEEDLKTFLFDRYQKKDKLLDSYYKTGSFSSDAKEAKFPSDVVLFGFQVLQLIIFGCIVKLFISLFIWF